MRAKARLVAKGFSQQDIVDHFDAFATIPSQSSLRVAVTVPLEHELNFNRFDVEQAVVQSDLAEDIYMKMPRVAEICVARSGF